MMRATPRRNAGFTLVELLVAIMILTLFMTASMGAVRIASKSWAAGQQRADATEQMRSVADFLRRQFAQLPSLTVGEGDDERLAFVGAGEGVMFVTSAPQYSQGPGLVTYVLRGEEVDGEKLLTLRYAPFDPGHEGFVLPDRNERIILARDFEAIEFRYYGAPKEKDIVEWLDAWPRDAEFYPRAIYVRTSGEGESDGWPDFVFELRSGGDS
jgi:prepilin-type N-terminal cleavage/methylation domain-containing protein